MHWESTSVELVQDTLPWRGSDSGDEQRITEMMKGKLEIVTIIKVIIR